MNITMLGTGNALATECFNTCFILHKNGNCLLVDTGGGSTILQRLKHSGFPLTKIHDIFITHSHIDHLLGVIWIIRIASQLMNKDSFPGDINIYSHDEVIPLIDELARKLLLPYQYSFIGRRIHLITLHDTETRPLIGQNFTFFDIHSSRTKQFGFSMRYGTGQVFTFCGDEPCHPSCEHYAAGSSWLFHEAFCMFRDAGKFKPYEKHHSTVKDSSSLAQRLGVKNLILSHTEDSDLANRKTLYTQEARQYFTGNVFIPDDLETLTLL